MAILSYQNYIDLMKSGIYRQKIKIEVLRKEDFSVFSTITGDIVNGSGSLNCERKNGMRRTCNFSLINSCISYNGKYIPNIDKNILPPRQPFKLWLGVFDEFNNEYWTSQGIFFLEDPQVTSNFSESIVDINCIDAFGLFDGTLGGEVNNTYIIPLNSNIHNVLKSILNLQNYPLPPILDSQYNSEVTPYTITKQAGEGTLADIMIELATMLSANIFFNQDGNLVFEKDYNDDIKSSLFEFTTEEAIYQGATNTTKYSELYNSILVIGSNVNSLGTFIGEATNINLLSSTSVNNLGFKRQKLINNSLVYSNDLALQLANYLLKRTISVQNEISINSVPLYHLDVDNIITTTDKNNLNLDKKRYLITGYTIPFQIGSKMTIKAVDSVDLEFGDL